MDRIDEIRDFRKTMDKYQPHESITVERYMMDIDFLLQALAERDEIIRRRDKGCEIWADKFNKMLERCLKAEADNNALVIDLEVVRKALDRAEAKIAELEDCTEGTANTLDGANKHIEKLEADNAMLRDALDKIESLSTIETVEISKIAREALKEGDGGK